MDLYESYLKERGGFEVLQSEGAEGFATYRFEDHAVYIRDIYIAPDFRRRAIGTELADRIALIARKAGKVQMLGTVMPDDPAADGTIRTLFAYGMRFAGINGMGQLLFVKDLAPWVT